MVLDAQGLEFDPLAQLQPVTPGNTATRSFYVFSASWQSVSCFGHGDETMKHSSSMSSILAILYLLYKATRRTLRNNSPEGSRTEQWIQPCVLAPIVIGWNLRWIPSRQTPKSIAIGAATGLQLCGFHAPLWEMRCRLVKMDGAALYLYPQIQPSTVWNLV